MRNLIRVAACVVLSSLSAYGQTFISPGGVARRFVRVSGVPASCSAGDVMVDISVSPAIYYNCPVATPVVFGGAAATISLNNLASTAVNADIIPAVASVRNLGSIALPWGTVVAKDATSLASLGAARGGLAFKLISTSGAGAFGDYNGIGYADAIGPYWYDDNADGGNGAVVVWNPQSVSGIKTITVPNITGTLLTNNSTATLTNKTATTLIENGVRVAVSGKTADYTLTSTDYVITVDATGGNVTLTLPAASASVGQTYRIKRIDGSVNTITVARAGADTIDGATSATLVTQYSSKDIVCLTTSTWGVF